jgi:hypothetical protein
VKWLTNKTGDVRDRVVFAWKPKKCADGFTRRFVFLNVREVFQEARMARMASIFGGGPKPESWEPARYTPIKHDAEAEAEASAAQLIRDSRPKAQLWFTGTIGSISFGPSVVEGDEWKGGESKKKDDDTDDDDQKEGRRHRR